MLVTWNSGGHHMVGSVEQVADGVATVCRIINGGGIRPEKRLIPLEKLQVASNDGPEGSSLELQLKLQEQQQQWLAYHDKLFDEYIPTTYPDVSYTKDYSLTSSDMLRGGRAYVVPDGLINSYGLVYTSYTVNRFGKVVQLGGYVTESLDRWPFITRSSVQGELPLFGTVLASQHGSSVVVRERHVWLVSGQHSPGEWIRLKSTGEELVVIGISRHRRNGCVFYDIQGGRCCHGGELERIDTAGDQIITL